MNQNNSTGQDPENDFLEVFHIDKVDEKILTTTITKSQESISKILRIPTNTIIMNYEIFTRHPFGGSLQEREAQSFYNALLYVSKFIYLLNKMIESKQDIKKVSDPVRRLLYDNWDSCKNCPQLQHIMKAAFGLVSDDDEFLNSSFQSEYISFLADVFLLQSTLCSTRFFQNILIAVGKIFVMIPIKVYPNRINSFRDNERNSTFNGEHSTDFQSFLRLVGNISRLRRQYDDFAYMFHQEGNIFIHYATDYTSKALFATFIDTLAALTKSKAIAEEFYKRLNESLSDIINLHHIVEVFSGYASDFQNSEISQNKLDYDDTNSLEAILRLLSGFFTFSKSIRDDIIDDINGRYDETRTGFIPTLFNLISSPIPASLKAAIFNTLAAITVDTTRAEDIWQQLESSQILTKESVDSGKGGIIEDINVVEGDAKNFPLLRAFISFLAAFLHSNPSLKIFESGGHYFTKYHQFLMEQGLLKLRTRIYSHFHEKWSILSKICQAWTNLIIYSMNNSNKEASACLMQTALCDSRFIEELITLINEDEIPEQSLLCIFRLFLLIIENEPKFLNTMSLSDRFFYTPLTKRFCWSSSALIKLIQCVASKDYDLQLATLNLAQHLAKDSPEIAQKVFSKPQSRSIYSFKKVIDFDDKESKSEDGESERNVRNTLLEMLISLGSASHFVRYVCNFDMSELSNSTLIKGILPEILRKMKETEAAKWYPIFAANSLKLLLMMCDDHLTSKPLLNLLRTSSQSFFDEQLLMLQDKRCSLTAIGCFLQLLAREASDSMHDSYSSTTIQTFHILMETNGFREQGRHRIVLIDEFIDRIRDGKDDECVARGIAETTDAYIKSTSILHYMRGDNQGKWSNIWCQLLNHLLQKMGLIRNSVSIDLLSQSVSFIADFLFDEHCLGEISGEERLQILISANNALVGLDQNIHSRTPRIGIYKLFHSMKLDDLDVFHDFEIDLIEFISNDIKSDIPVLRATVYAAAEAIIPIVSVSVFTKFVVEAIHDFNDHRISQNKEATANNYDYFIESPGASLMIGAKFSFFSRLIALMFEEYKFALIENSLITSIEKESFWNNVRESFFTSNQYIISEVFLQIASQALYVITDLCIVASDNDLVKKQVKSFYKAYYEDQFLPVFQIPESLTISALKFLIILTKFLMSCPSEINEKPEVSEMITDIKQQFVNNSERIKDRICVLGDKDFSKPPIEIQREADEVIESFKQFC